MAIQQRNLEAMSLITLYAPVAVTANGDTTAVDVSSIDGDAVVILTHAASSGGTSIDAKLQTGDLANGSDAVDVTGGAFTTLADAAGVQRVTIPRDQLGKYLRISFTGEVSTYSAVVGAAVLGVNKYMS